MVLSNMDIMGVILAAAIAGVGSGIGVAIGNAIYKALLEEKINAFLDKRHREEALKKIKNLDVRLDQRFKRNGETNASRVVDNILGRREEGKETNDIVRVENPNNDNNPSLPAQPVRRFL